MRRIQWITLVVLVGLSACGASGDRPDDGDAEPVWVAQTFTGGRQCMPREEFEPPDTAALLGEAGVEVVDTAEVPNAVLRTVEVPNGVCMSCECPTYSAVHYALIEASGLERAGELGFEPSQAPESP